jgi:hypothetical protein
VFAAFFGMTRQPFTAEVPADALFPSAPMQEALARLRFLVDQHGIALLWAETVSGVAPGHAQPSPRVRPSPCLAVMGRPQSLGGQLFTDLWPEASVGGPRGLVRPAYRVDPPGVR